MDRKKAAMVLGSLVLPLLTGGYSRVAIQRAVPEYRTRSMPYIFVSGA